MLALSDRESILFHSAAVPSWSCASIVLSRVVYYTITWYATATPTSIRNWLIKVYRSSRTSRVLAPTWKQCVWDHGVWRGWFREPVCRRAWNAQRAGGEWVLQLEREKSNMANCVYKRKHLLSRWWITFDPKVIIFTYGCPDTNSCIHEYKMIPNLTTVEEKGALI